MSGDDRHRPIEAARLRAELSVQDLWLRYLALGGTADAFELDGYLHGVVQLETFQEDVLAQAVNEALADIYDAARVPLTVSSPPDGGDADSLADVVAELLGRALTLRDQDDPPPARGPR
ncbi:MAG: hypothetical protein JWQ99_1876 [Blastococcus sp.]|jgi:hypothetical protein|nr:hypothetical protein [Blastococcus sp.]